MLENSNLIQGSNAKLVNKLLKEYQDITIKLSDLDKSKRLVLEQLFKLAEVGVNETSGYAFNVVLNKGRETINVKNLSEQAPKIYNAVKKQNLINISEPYKTIRSIREKGKRS